MTPLKKSQSPANHLRHHLPVNKIKANFQEYNDHLIPKSESDNFETGTCSDNERPINKFRIAFVKFNNKRNHPFGRNN